MNYLIMRIPMIQLNIISDRNAANRNPITNDNGTIKVAKYDNKRMPKTIPIKIGGCVTYNRINPIKLGAKSSAIFQFYFLYA